MSDRLLEVVNYTCLGRTVKALVLSARDGEVSHLGKQGEPLLTLAVIKQPAPNAPHKRLTVLQNATGTPEIETVHDVVHASHEFSKEFKEAKGILTDAHVANHRGLGEWSEVYFTSPDAQAVPDDDSDSADDGGPDGDDDDE